MPYKFLTDKTLKDYPDLQRFLNDDSDNFPVTIDELSKIYNIHTSFEKFTDPYSLLQILSYEKKLNHLPTYYHTRIRDLVKANGYLAIELAILSGDLPTLQRLETYLNENEIKQAAARFYCHTLQNATSNHQFAIVMHLEDQLSAEEIKESSISYLYEDGVLKEFTKDYSTDYGKLVNYLTWGEEKTAKITFPKKNNLTERQKTKAALYAYFKAIERAAFAGNLNKILFVENRLTDEEKKWAVKINQYETIINPIKYDHLATVEHLLNHLNSNEKKEAVTIHDFKVYLKTLNQEQFAMSRFLESHFDEQDKSEAARTQGYQLINEAAQRGDLALIKHFETYLGKWQIIEAITDYRHRAFFNAIENGHLDIVQHFESHLKEEKREPWRVKYDLNQAIRLSSQHGHLPLFKYFAQKLSKDEIQKIITYSDYQLIKETAYAGHLAMFQHLESYLSLDDKREMVTHNQWYFLHSMLLRSTKYALILDRLLEIDIALGYAEMQENELVKQLVSAFIDKKMALFQKQKIAFESAKPKDSFDLTISDANSAFYMLNNFIRRGGSHCQSGQESLINDIEFLLRIPIVKSRAHQAVFGCNANHLLRHAISNGYQPAAELLLLIPEVLKQASRDNFYRKEIPHGLDAAQLVPNPFGFFTHKERSNEDDKIAMAVKACNLP